MKCTKQGCGTSLRAYLFSATSVLYSVLTFATIVSTCTITDGAAAHYTWKGTRLSFVMKSDMHNLADSDVHSKFGPWTLFDFAEDDRLLYSIVCQEVL